MTYDVCVVIPAYKAERSIEQAVRSVLGQPGIAAQVVVVIDDGSEATRATVEAIGADAIHCIMNPANMGAQVSRNAGLEAARAPYVMFLDADDYLEGDLLGPLVTRLHVARAQIGFGPWIRREAATGVSHRSGPLDTSAQSLFRQWLVEEKWTPPCAILWDAAWLRGIGGWDEAVKRNQDGELVLRALLLGARFVTSDAGAGIYVQHASEHRISLSTSNYDSLVYVAEKLAEIDSDVVPPAERGPIIGEYIYGVAQVHFWHSEWALGRRALGLARRLGYRGHHGPLLSRLSYRLLGMERQQRLWQWLRGFRQRRRDLARS